MGKDPGLILKQQTAKAIHRIKTVESAENETILTKAHNKTGSYCLPYNEVVRAFLVEGYTDVKAEKYISKWADYDLVWVGYMEGYHLIGFSEVN